MHVYNLDSKIGENRDESNKSAIKLWKTEVSDSASLRRMARTKTAKEKTADEIKVL